MFEQFFKRNEQKSELAAEKRNMEFTKEQNVMNSTLQPADDQTYIKTQGDKSDLIRWQQQLDEELFDQILTFMSVRKTEDGKIEQIIDEKGNPLPSMCNQLFIYQVVIPKCKPFMNKNLINSQLDERTILQMQKDTHNDIADMMADNWDKYGIDPVNYDGVIRDMKNLISASIWRAHKGWTKKTDSSMIKRVESLSESPLHQQKGKISSLFERNN